MADPRWLDAEAAADYISVRVDALPRLVKQGRIPPPVKRGKKMVWDANAIDSVFGPAPTLILTPPVLDRSEPFAGLLLSATQIVEEAKSWEPRTGIYFLLLRGTIVYVGQSLNVFARLSQHVKDKTFDSWHWVPCPISQIMAAERAYIQALKPTLNRTMVNG